MPGTRCPVPGFVAVTTRVAIMVSGTGTNMEVLLDAMADSDFGANPVMVLSNRPGIPALEKAANRGIRVVCIDHRHYPDNRLDFDAAIDAALRQARVSVVCLAGFMRILGFQFVSAWKGRILNIHPSLLPEFPGLDTHRRVIETGKTFSGCTVHAVTPELDAGPILGQAAVPVLPDDTPTCLAARVNRAEHRLYPAVLRRFLNKRRETPTRLTTP